MPRRKRPVPRPPPLPEPPLTLPPPEGESLEDLIERAERIKRTSDSLIRQMRELEAQIADAKARPGNRPF
jgi:hypothetical protein